MGFQKTRALTAILIAAVFLSTATSDDPCQDHTEINEVKRSAAAEVGPGESILCDNAIAKGWYRFISYVGGEIPTTCVEPYHCGTQVPIWMNGTLPTDSTVVMRQVCSNFGVTGNCCPLSWNIQVKRCTDTQGVFYVYELEQTGSCYLAYCAGTLPLCPDGEIYDQYHGICMETRHPVPCDFESIGTCEWHQQTNDDFDWTKHSRAASEAGLLPGSNNTIAAGTGKFLYISTDAGQQPLDTARLISPIIVPSVVRSCNMTFSRYQSGPNAGDLDIFARTSKQTIAWQESPKTSGIWETSTVSFPHREPFQVIIQGGVGYGRDAVLAIDDISFSWDCVREVDGSVRLVDGESFDEGRVEIYYNHRWGTICNIGWTQTSADVVCAQLGYRASVWTDTRFPGPSSTTPIMLDEVTCDSVNKSKITDCRTKEWGTWDISCNHDKDVSVRCVGQWHQCSADDFVCDNTVCLPETARCDFKDDCGDGSDEDDCSSYPGRCDFQNDFCSWIQDKDDLTDWTRGLGGSEADIPLVDHEGRTDGYFLYITGATSANATLTLPTFFIANGSNCLILFYYIHNANDATVAIRIHTNTSTMKIWEQNEPQGPTWLKEEVSLTSLSAFKVSIEASFVTSSVGYIAIDDVTFTPGCIIKRTGCSEATDTFECNSGECISMDHVCDYQKNCVDGSDETNCTNIRCDFEGGFCSWSRNTSNTLQFERGRETTSTGGTGPLLDHTHQNPLGYYAFVDASGRHRGQKTELVSQFLAEDKPCQFRYFYHMQGRNIGKLRVLLKSKSGNLREVWKREGQQGRGWLFGSVSLKEPEQYQVLLEATIGDGDQGDIAVDDVSFATYCVQYTDTVDPITSTEISYQASRRTTLQQNKSSVATHPSNNKVDVTSAPDDDGTHEGNKRASSGTTKNHTTTVIVIPVTVIVVIAGSVTGTVIIVRRRRRKNVNGSTDMNLRTLPPRLPPTQGDDYTYEDTRNNVSSIYESIKEVNGRDQRSCSSDHTYNDANKMNGACAMVTSGPLKDEFSLDTGGYASLLKNTMETEVVGKTNPAYEEENLYTLPMDMNLRSFLKKNGFSDYINVLSENEITFDKLESYEEIDLVKLGMPLAQAHKMLTAIRNDSQYQNIRSKEPIPVKYLCPITKSVMKDPVRANDGHIYDKAAIMSWYEKNGGTPSQKVSSLDLYPDNDLRKEIKRFRRRQRKRGEVSQKHQQNQQKDDSKVKVESSVPQLSRPTTPMTDVEC